MHLQDYSVKIIKLSPEMGDGYIAEVDELPGCIADGNTPEETLSKIRDAIRLWIDVQRKIGREVPMPKMYRGESEYSGRISLRTSKSLHASLVKIAESEGVSLNSFINDTLAEKVGFLQGYRKTAVDTSYVPKMRKRKKQYRVNRPKIVKDKLSVHAPI